MNLASRLHEAGEPNVLVVGDFIRDIASHGKMTRIAQEAACPVFHVTSQEETPGGAGAVAAMVEALGANVTLVAADGPAVKHRYFVDGKQVFRTDFDSNRIVDQDAIIGIIRDSIGEMDCVLIADYGKGTCTPNVLRTVIDLAKIRGIQCIVDPAHGADWTRYLGANCIKCNNAEFESGPNNWDVRRTGGGQFIFSFPFERVLITKGARGIHPLGEAVISSKARNSVDPTGCGDMVLAAIGVCRAVGFDWSDACRIGNVAAGLKCERLGAVPVSRGEVILDLWGRKDVPSEFIRYIRQTDKRIIFTNGVFRVPHAGHAWLLRWAKAQGDILIVGINSTESAARQCPNEYVMPLEERVQIISEFASVDYVIAFPDDTPENVLRLLGPQTILVKGPEYTGQNVPGSDIAAETRFAPASPYPAHATTVCEAIMDKYRPDRPIG